MSSFDFLAYDDEEESKQEGVQEVDNNEELVVALERNKKKAFGWIARKARQLIFRLGKKPVIH